MELGNYFFGNSRGEYPVPRDAGYEKELERLFDACTPDREDEWGYRRIEEFENDVFSVFPYYWGDCTCGYADKEYEWVEANKHRPDCYQSELERRLADDEEKHKVHSEMLMASGDDEVTEWEVTREFKRRVMKQLCDEMGIEWNDGYGCWAHCTCDYKDKWRAFCANNHHTPDCLLVRPNFHYKPTNYQLRWYKYPLRDSYANQKLTLSQFRKMIDHCIQSLTGDER